MMKSNFLTDYAVDKANKKIGVKREFAAPVAMVWKAWTTAEILDQWWAPRPYTNHTQSMDFREGGMWLYYMASPEGQVHWCRNDYQKIDTGKSFTGYDAFCDEQGNINEDFPRTKWNIVFSGSGESSRVDITLTYDDLADLEKIIAMGFQEGFAMGLEQLDEWLAKN